MAKSNEPLWWSLFSAGGVVSAFLCPITILLTGVAIPAGWLTEDSLLELVHQPIARLYLFLLISLPLFHWAHRFRFTLVDLGLRGMGGLLAVPCYGTAIVGTLLGGWILIRL